MELKLDFKSDYKAILKKVLTNLNFTNLPEDIFQLLIIWYNYQHRLIKSHNRAILRASNFLCPINLEEGLSILENIILNGKDLKPHLSRKIFDAQFDDMMLNDWGITHFHLGNNIKSNGLIQDTSKILYARVTNDTVYFLLIAEHGEWSNIELLRIIHNNWPESIAHFKVENVIELEHNTTTEDVKSLRKNNINTTNLEIDGTFYFSPGGGFTSSGHSNLVLFHSKKVLNQIIKYEDYIRTKYKDYILNKYKKAHMINGNEIVVLFTVNTKGIAYAEIPDIKLIIKLGKL